MKLGFLAATVVIVCVAASEAHAFQIVPADTNPDGTAKFTDPDLRTQNLADRYQSRGGTTTMTFGNTTLQFGAPSSNGPSPALQDRFLQNPAARTVPSQGW